MDSENRRDIERLRRSLPAVAPVSCPVLVMLSGLPGSGKSYFARWLSAHVPLCVVESDRARSILFGRPSFTAAESARLFRALHALLAELLADGVPVLFDATNVQEAHRRVVYDIVEQARAGLVIVHLTASPSVIYQRLVARAEQPGQESAADWEVYRRMKANLEPIRRPHFAINTDGDTEAAFQHALEECRRRLNEKQEKDG